MHGNKCDMRGLLSFQVLWLLSKRPMHGDEIAEEIGNRRGDKPKAGTIYPALKELKENRLIKGSKNGKMITYSLTNEGKAELKQGVMYLCRSFGDVFEERYGAAAANR
ncbi:MAG: PadR family transcriptional regulator [Candidatus Micrarchaeota archaeon]|nr:PadR family transcriptional regulator [Candidatus Micrarchaeota archaeon]MDE1849453.1 PadR family transcriptional regulator [Candidatus Micrarchaeota archaeon]